jgi:hypothetical protein
MVQLRSALTPQAKVRLRKSQTPDSQLITFCRESTSYPRASYQSRPVPSGYKKGSERTMVSQTCSLYAPSDVRRFTRTHHSPYTFTPDRRFHSHHEQRLIAMTDSEADSDPSQQRKRIPVAVSCGRLPVDGADLLPCDAKIFSIRYSDRSTVRKMSQAQDQMQRRSWRRPTVHELQDRRD